MKRQIFLILATVALASAFSPQQRHLSNLGACSTASTRPHRGGFFASRVARNAVDDPTIEDVTCWNPQLRRTMGAVAAAGSLETAYLTFTKLSGAEPALCSTAGVCASVLNGPYAWIPGTNIPLAVLGFLAYTSVVALALGPFVQKKSEDDEGNRVALTVITTAMGVFSIFLMTILFGVLKESCVYCIASAVFSISLATLSWLGGSLPKQRVKDGVALSTGGGLFSFLVAVFIFVNADVPQVAHAGELVGSSSPTTLLLNSKGEAPPTITTVSSARAVALAEDLETLDARFFGAFWCGHCFDQKQTMGKQAMKKIPYIECSRDGLDSQSDLCKSRNVPGYPTWEINGKLYPGEKDLEELEAIVKNVATK
jgi:uncharacterized membrane protein